MYNEIFRSRIKETREEIGLTQTKVAAELQITQSAYAKYELGTVEPNINTIEKIADLYDVSTDWLFGRGQKNK